MVKFLWGDEVFRTKKDAEFRAREIIQRNFERYLPIASEDGAKLLTLLEQHHPNAATKIPTVPFMFHVGYNPAFGRGNHLSFVDQNGKLIDTVSWKWCFVSNKSPETAINFDLSNEMRTDSWVSKKYEKIKCDVCGSTDSLQIDHKNPTFEFIKRSFWETRPENNATERLATYREGCTRGEWIAYHDSVAVVQTLCKPCHNEKTNRERCLRT